MPYPFLRNLGWRIEKYAIFVVILNEENTNMITLDQLQNVLERDEALRRFL
jgi:hypothetical protein